MKHKILVADDEDRIRNLIKTTLELEDGLFEIHEANDGNSALEKIFEIRPDMVILDVMMPGKSGYEVCKIVKNNPETKDTFILFLTARGSTISTRTIELSGGDEYMAKPFALGDLIARVKKGLKMN